MQHALATNPKESHSLATPKARPTLAPGHPTLQRKCACGGRRGPTGECAECRKKTERTLQRRASGPEPTEVPTIVHEVLRSPGQPLDAATRRFMEPRFGHDFGAVRVHTNSRAAESAQAVNALAYTVGQSVVFGHGQYAPESSSGRRLMAHELTHTVQQLYGGIPTLSGSMRVGETGNADELEADAVAEKVVLAGSNETGAISIHPAASATQRIRERRDATSHVLRRLCGPSAIGTPTGCAVPPDYGNFVTGRIYRFNMECDTFASGEETRMWLDARALPSGSTLVIHGFASVDGDATFNHNLACARARAAEASLTSPGPVGGGVPGGAITGLLNHGPTGGPAADRRSVVLVVTTPTKPEPPTPTGEKPKCGPDVTDWFVSQVSAAMTRADVVAIQRDLTRANTLAGMIGTTAQQIGEGGAAAAVLAQEARLGVTGPPPPARNPAINAQLAAGTVSGAAAAGAMGALVPFDPRRATIPVILGLLAKAAFGWKALVDHGAPFDFKAHVLNHPRSAHCPDEGCPPGEVGIITLCPGTNPENCYESDVPGNLFYALIGRFVGFSELTLQLGSQLAELTDVRLRPARPSVTWDSPEDTQAITLGFALPLPMSRSALCSAIGPARSTLGQRVGCDDCPDIMPP